MYSTYGIMICAYMHDYDEWKDPEKEVTKNIGVSSSMKINLAHTYTYAALLSTTSLQHIDTDCNMYVTQSPMLRDSAWSASKLLMPPRE